MLPATDAGASRASLRAPLASYVNAYHAYDEQDTSFRRRRELPDGSAVLIFNLGKSRVEHPAGTVSAFGEGDGFFSGAAATYAVTETDGAQAGARSSSVCGRPALCREAADRAGRWACRSIGGVRPPRWRTGGQGRRGAFPGRAPGASVAGGRAAGQFGGRDRAGSGIRIQASQPRRYPHRRDRAPDWMEAGALLERLSSRVGLSPKTFARIRRFARTLREREREPSLNGAMLAAQCGYVDQAHVILDFQGRRRTLWRRNCRARAVSLTERQSHFHKIATRRAARHDPSEHSTEIDRCRRPRARSDHPVSLLPRRSRRARLSHPRLRLQGGDAS